MRALLVNHGGFGEQLKKFDLIQQLKKFEEKGLLDQLMPWEITDTNAELKEIIALQSSEHNAISN